MLPFEKYQFISRKQFMFLIVLFENGSITFSTQTIYKRRGSFNSAMRYLLECKAVEKISEGRHYAYKISENGYNFVKGLMR